MDLNYRFLVTQIQLAEPAMVVKLSPVCWRTTPSITTTNSPAGRWVPREAAACHSGWCCIAPKAISLESFWKTEPLSGQSHIYLQAVKCSHDRGEGLIDHSPYNTHVCRESGHPTFCITFSQGLVMQDEQSFTVGLLYKCRVFPPFWQDNVFVYGKGAVCVYCFYTLIYLTSFL